MLIFFRVLKHISHQSLGKLECILEMLITGILEIQNYSQSETKIDILYKTRTLSEAGYDEMSPGVGADAVAIVDTVDGADAGADAFAISVACADEGVTGVSGGDAGVGAHIVLCA